MKEKLKDLPKLGQINFSIYKCKVMQIGKKSLS